MIVDAFAGPGGWSEGVRRLGLAEVGVEMDADACATRAAAGHLTIRADVATWPAERFAGAEGLILSPPCPDWSRAGKGARMAGTSGALVLEVLRWTAAIRPVWIACEQVDTVAEVWASFGRSLERLGYRWWSGLVNAADYGVPQTRVRALLLCSLAGQPHRPPRTHAERPEDDLLGERLLPWVSMAEALGLDEGLDLRTGTTTKPRNGAQRPYHRDADRPAPTVTPNGDRWRLRSAAHSRPNDRTGLRPLDRPAPTLAFGHAAAGFAWVLETNRGQDEEGRRQVRPTDEPAPALTGKSGGQWYFRRPATTIAGDARVFAPGRHPDASDVHRRPGRSEGAIPITLAEALVLQDFPPDYPVVGRTKESRFRQVGNAVPPGLAAAAVAHLRGLGTEAARPPAPAEWHELVPAWLVAPSVMPRAAETREQLPLL